MLPARRAAAPVGAPTTRQVSQRLLRIHLRGRGRACACSSAAKLASAPRTEAGAARAKNSILGRNSRGCCCRRRAAPRRGGEERLEKGKARERRNEAARERRNTNVGEISPDCLPEISPAWSSDECASEPDSDTLEGHLCVIWLGEQDGKFDIGCELAQHRPKYHHAGSLVLLDRLSTTPAELPASELFRQTRCTYVTGRSLLGESIPLLGKTYLSALLGCMNVLQGISFHSRMRSNSARCRTHLGQSTAEQRVTGKIVYYPLSTWNLISIVESVRRTHEYCSNTRNAYARFEDAYQNSPRHLFRKTHSYTAIRICAILEIPSSLRTVSEDREHIVTLGNCLTLRCTLIQESNYDLFQGRYVYFRIILTAYGPLASPFSKGAHCEACFDYEQLPRDVCSSRRYGS